MLNKISQTNFYSPYFLALIPIICVLYYWSYKKGNLQDNALKFSSLTGLNQTRSIKLKLLPSIHLLNLIGLCFLTIALARPRVYLAEETLKADGIDIMLTLDLSTSMLARDFEPNRLEVSKKLAADFVAKRKHDRIGLVVFSGESFTQCPATTDHSMLKNFIESQEIGILQDGTAIGMGVATAVNRIKGSSAKSKIIILLTDGVNNTGYIDPNMATDMAVSENIKIYSIGIGTEGIALMPVSRSMSGEYFYGPQQVQIDEALLKNMAEKTGGMYFRATDAASLSRIYDTIDKLEKTEIEMNVFKRYEENFRPFALTGLFIIMCSFILSHTYLRVFP